MKRMTAPQVLTPKEIAQEWGISAKTLRKFLRANARAVSLKTGNPLEVPGKGGRWSIERKSLKSLRKGFDAYIAELDAKRAEQASKEETPESPELPEMLDAPDHTDDLDALETGDAPESPTEG
jgi:hypothetical protein